MSSSSVSNPSKFNFKQFNTDQFYDRRDLARQRDSKELLASYDTISDTSIRRKITFYVSLYKSKLESTKAYFQDLKSTIVGISSGMY